MRRRGLPIAWIGIIAVLVAYVVWYGWQMSVAPLLQERRAQQQSAQPQEAPPVPTEAEVKAQLERNKAAIAAQPEPKPKQVDEKPKAVPQMSQPDPRRNVMEYWWEQAPPKTKQ